MIASIVVATLCTVSCAERATGGRSGDERPGDASPSPSLTDPSDAFETFTPVTRTEGDRVVLPVVFPDGSTAELVYPPALDLARLSVRPYWVACGHDVGFSYYDPQGTLYEGEPIQTWMRDDGQRVGVYQAVDREAGGDGKPIVYLIFHFGDWTLDVYDYGGNAAMSEQERKACATGLSATITDDGWIVLSGSPRIDLGGHVPALEFGGLGDTQPFVLLFPGPCESWPDARREIGGVMVELTDDFAAWCHPGGMMRIHVYFTGEPVFVEQLVRHLRVRNVHLAT